MLYRFDSFGCSVLFEDDAQLREVFVEFEERGKEPLIGVEDSDI